MKVSIILKEAAIVLLISSSLGAIYRAAFGKGPFATRSRKENTVPAAVEIVPAPEMISLADVQKYVHDSAAIFIDARKPFEYIQGHIGNARNIPLDKFAQHTRELLALQKHTLLVCYCDGRGCSASIELAAKIASLGFRNVKIYYDGWQEWTSASMPVEK